MQELISDATSESFAEGDVILHAGAAALVHVC